MAIQRQNIAKGGQSSISAREQIIKHYMTLKANEYTYTKTIKLVDVFFPTEILMLSILFFINTMLYM